MTHPDRAIEAGARAICIAVGDDPDQSTYAREMACSGNERGPQARWQYWTEHAAAVITAYREYLAAESFVVVPAVPTQAMLDAATSTTSGYGGPDHDYDDDVRDHWSAMLAAAQEQDDASN
ncbi:MAG: hypothetical protein WBB07_24365 [Mycobacterium sp.]